MREFRIKVNNEKTYVVKANDYNQAVKTLHSKLKDNAVSDSISKYNGEDAIRTNGFVKIKEDGDWTSYKYNGSDFDGAVFKIHQYNPSLIAFVSNGNRTITVRNKYLNDSADNTAQGEIEVLKSFGFDYKDGKWVKESNNNNIIVQPDYHYVSVIGPGDTEKHCKKYQYQSAGMLKKIIASNIKDSSIQDVDWDFARKLREHSEEEIINAIKYSNPRLYKEYKNGGIQFARLAGQLSSPEKEKVLKRLGDSSIKDVSYVSGKNLKIGQKIVEDGEVLEVVDIKETQRGVNNNYRDVTLKNVKTGATETVHFGNNALARLNDYSPDITDADPVKAGKDPKQAAAIAYSVQRENDASTGYKFRITNNGSKWYYETTFPDGHTTLTGPYSSKQETEQYFHKHRPTEKLTDADPVKVEKIIRKEKSALGITYYIFQTKSSSGYTIYYQVTDKTYHGEPTYSGGGIISFSLKSANDTLDHNLLSDKLKAKYGEKEGTKRYLRGENDSAIKDSSSIKNRISYDDLKRTINRVMEEGNDKDVVNILIGQLSELRKDYEADIKNSKLDKEETKRHYGEYKRLVNNYKNSHISKEYTNAVNSFLSAIKDSNNIKNRKSYTIKVGDKQYKVFAESESEAINKYIKSKKQ